MKKKCVDVLVAFVYESLHSKCSPCMKKTDISKQHPSIKLCKFRGKSKKNSKCRYPLKQKKRVNGRFHHFLFFAAPDIHRVVTVRLRSARSLDGSELGDENQIRCDWWCCLGINIWMFSKMVGFPKNHGFSY